MRNRPDPWDLPDYAHRWTADTGRLARRDWWPWDPNDFKTGGGIRRQFVKAGALVAAEIDRLDRRQARANG